MGRSVIGVDRYRAKWGDGSKHGDDDGGPPRSRDLLCHLLPPPG